MRDYVTDPRTGYMLPPSYKTRPAINVHAEALRNALGRFLAGTDQPGQLLAAMLEHGPVLCKFDSERAGWADREIDNAD